jgi:hypothetical protein
LIGQVNSLIQKTQTNCMRLLLDENLPKQLKSDFREFDISTVREQGWNGVKNGELLKLLLANDFDALLTFDKNLQHQQNFEKYTITVFVLVARINRYEELSRLTPMVKRYLNQGQFPKGVILIREEAS